MKYINVPLVSNPLNWVVVGIMATVWLFALHSVVTAFNSMKSSSSG